MSAGISSKDLILDSILSRESLYLLFSLILEEEQLDGCLKIFYQNFPKLRLLLQEPGLQGANRVSF